MKRTFDLRDLECPKPVIETKKIVEKYKGDEVEIILNSKISKENVIRFLNNSGINFLEKQENENYIIYFVNSGAENAAPIDDITCKANKGKNIIISSHHLGRGDDQLGAILMKSFIYTLSQSPVKPRNIFFVNSGVFLTTEGSPVIEELNVIKSSGCDIYSCGTCLDYYKLKDKLKIGSIGNMALLLEFLNEEALFI